jgi:hypothetical protein
MAGAVAAAAFSIGCREHKSEPSGAVPPPPDEARPSAALEPDRAPAKPERCHAAWPMPNVPGSHLPNAQTFDTSDPDVAKDRVTGLSWQRAVDAKGYPMRQGAAYCRGLTLGGHHDWRLPEVIELVSIADTSRAEPAVDPVAFANTPSMNFWSSQTDITQDIFGWFVSFKTGGVYVGDPAIHLGRVRCVSGPPSCKDPDAGASPYAVSDDAVQDLSTGLVWKRAVEHDNYTWDAAKAFCAKVAVDGGAFRLPSLRELLTLVDIARFDPAIDTSAFPGTPGELFWTSSPSHPSVGTAWGVHFTRGSSAAAAVGTKAHVRCVR